MGSERVGDDVRRILARLVCWVLWTYKWARCHVNRWVESTTGCRRNSPVGWVKLFFENFVGKPGGITDSVGEQRPSGLGGEHAVPFHSQPHHSPTSVRVRRHHPTAVLGQRARPDQVQRLVLLVPFVVDLRSMASTPSCCGAAVTSPGGCARLLRRLRHQHVRGCVWLRRRLGARPRLLRDRPTRNTNNLVMGAVGLASCGSAGTVSTAATRTTRVVTPRPRSSTRTSRPYRRDRLDCVGRLALQGQSRPSSAGSTECLRPRRDYTLVPLGQRSWRHRVGAIPPSSSGAPGTSCPRRPFKNVDDALGRHLQDPRHRGFLGGMLLASSATRTC